MSDNDEPVTSKWPMLRIKLEDQDGNPVPFETEYLVAASALVRKVMKWPANKKLGMSYNSPIHGILFYPSGYGPEARMKELCTCGHARGEHAPMGKCCAAPVKGSRKNWQEEYWIHCSCKQFATRRSSQMHLTLKRLLVINTVFAVTTVAILSCTETSTLFQVIATAVGMLLPQVLFYRAYYLLVILPRRKG